MGDEQVGEAEFFLQVGEQVDDLRLDRHVERGHRLVADDELGPQDQRTCDADPLPLTTRELRGEPVVVLGVQADELHRLLDQRLAVVAVLAVRHAVDRQRVGDDRTDPAARVQRAVGVLEDHLDLPPIRPQPPPRQVGDVVAVERDAPRRDVVQPGHAAGQRRLPATRFADQAEGFAAPDLEAHVVHGMHDLATPFAQRGRLQRKVLDDVIEAQQHLGVRRSARWRRLESLRAHSVCPASVRAASSTRAASRAARSVGNQHAETCGPSPARARSGGSSVRQMSMT